MYKLDTRRPLSNAILSLAKTKPKHTAPFPQFEKQLLSGWAGVRWGEKHEPERNDIHGPNMTEERDR